MQVMWSRWAQCCHCPRHAHVFRSGRLIEGWWPRGKINDDPGSVPRLGVSPRQPANLDFHHLGLPDPQSRFAAAGTPSSTPSEQRPTPHYRETYRKEFRGLASPILASRRSYSVRSHAHPVTHARKPDSDVPSRMPSDNATGCLFYPQARVAALGGHSEVRAHQFCENHAPRIGRIAVT